MDSVECMHRKYVVIELYHHYATVPDEQLRGIPLPSLVR